MHLQVSEVFETVEVSKIGKPPLSPKTHSVFEYNQLLSGSGPSALVLWKSPSFSSFLFEHIKLILRLIKESLETCFPSCSLLEEKESLSSSKPLQVGTPIIVSILFSNNYVVSKKCHSQTFKMDALSLMWLCQLFTTEQ